MSTNWLIITDVKVSKNTCIETKNAYSVYTQTFINLNNIIKESSDTVNS